MSQLGVAPQPPDAGAPPVAVAAPIHSVLPLVWERGDRGVLRSFFTSAWRLAERGRSTWSSLARDGGGPASATLFAVFCSSAGVAWYALPAALRGYSYAHFDLRRGIVDSLLLGLGAVDALLLAAALFTIASSLFAAACARFVLRNEPAHPSFGALYRISCYAQSPLVLGLIGAALVPGLTEILCVFCRAHGYELVLGIPRGKALLATLLPPALLAGLAATGLVIVALWNNF